MTVQSNVEFILMFIRKHEVGLDISVLLIATVTLTIDLKGALAVKLMVTDLTQILMFYL